MALTKNISRTLQRQIDLTTAVCQERLLATHVRHVLAFVDLVADRVPFDDALDIYVRVLQLTPEQARNVGSRALAELGRRSGLPSGSQKVPNFAEDPHEDEHEAPVSGGRSDALFGRLRRRIRGRVHDELRQRIDYAAARAEDALLETHVENALIFAKALADEAQASDAVDLYIETLLLPEGIGDVVYNRALRILADEILPPLPSPREGRAGARSDAAVEVQPIAEDSVPA